VGQQLASPDFNELAGTYPVRIPSRSSLREQYADGQGYRYAIVANTAEPVI
jgi:hypothetical protein